MPTGIVVKQQWGDPYKGTMEEQYLSPQEGVLHVISTITVGPKTATTLQVGPGRGWGRGWGVGICWGYVGASERHEA